MKVFLAIALTFFMSDFKNDPVKIIGNWNGTLNVAAQNAKLPLVFKTKIQ